MDKNNRVIILAIVGLVVIIAAWYFLFETVPHGPQPFVTNITIINSTGSNINGVYVVNYPSLSEGASSFIESTIVVFSEKL